MAKNHLKRLQLSVQLQASVPRWARNLTELEDFEEETPQTRTERLLAAKKSFKL